MAAEEGVVESAPERRGRRRPAPQGAQQGPEPKIDIRYLVQRMDESLQRMYERFDIMERRQQWYMDAMTAFFARHGFHYPTPFPPTYQQ